MVSTGYPAACILCHVNYTRLNKYLCSLLCHVRNQSAEASVLQALTSAKGRGKTGLSEEQLQQLNAGIQTLEDDGGVRGQNIHRAAVARLKRCYVDQCHSSASGVNIVVDTPCASQLLQCGHRHEYGGHQC